MANAVLGQLEAAEACLSQTAERRENDSLWLVAGGWISDHGKANQEAMWRRSRMWRAERLIWC